VYEALVVGHAQGSGDIGGYSCKGAGRCPRKPNKKARREKSRRAFLLYYVLATFFSSGAFSLYVLQGVLAQWEESGVHSPSEQVGSQARYYRNR
jgi:hypothetical protein